MAQLNKDEAILRLEKITQEYSEKNPSSPVGVVTALDGSEYTSKAVISSHFSYQLMGKILYVINRSDNEYLIKSEGNNVVIIITFFT